MSDRKLGTGPACPRCGAAMKDIVTIAPIGDEPGLIAYECPKCGYVTSELQQARQPNGASSADGADA
jgi:rubredoxin